MQCHLWTARQRPVVSVERAFGIQQLEVIRAVAFSPDGKRILTGGDDKNARLWEATTSQPASRRSAQARSSPLAHIPTAEITNTTTMMFLIL